MVLRLDLMIVVLLIMHHLLLLVEVARFCMALHQGLIVRRHVRLIHHALLLMFMVLDEHALVLSHMLHVGHWHLLMGLLTDMSLTEPDSVDAALAEHLLVLGTIEALTSFTLLLRLGFWWLSEVTLVL